MKRSDVMSVIFLMIAVLIIYYPVFHAEYLYTDESGELWYGKKGQNFQTYISQGRYITYQLFTWVFNPVCTIRGLIFPRIFSLLGWLACLPLWYYILNKVVVDNGLPKKLGLLSLAYLVSMPPFSISVGWAACLELFIACTCGLISGYALYMVSTGAGKGRAVMILAIIISLLFGLLSLFTYQNCFGCFFIPFLIHLLASKKISKKTLLGIGGCLFIYAVYFLLFRVTIRTMGMEVSNRSTFGTDPAVKLIFFFTRPLASAFHFTCLFNEKSVPGLIIYLILAAAWLILCLVRQSSAPLRQKILYLSGLLVLFLLLYLPSLIVQENYASNRTLLALDLAVFFLVGVTLFAFLKKDKTRTIVTRTLSALFFINAWYNFNQGFVDPLTAEYKAIKDFVSLHIEPRTTGVYFIRPPENAFEKKYGIVASWDEFGVPSTAKYWTPEPLIRQLIFEKTGSRKLAESMIVRSWPDEKTFRGSGDTLSEGTLWIDGASMLSKR